MIIGITGTLGAGKSTVIDFLKEQGFNHYSVRVFLTQELEKRGLPNTRDNLVALGNELRQTYSPGYIVEQLYEQASKDGKDCIIESIRNVGEIEALQKKGPFRLLAIDADPRVRYERIAQRQHSTDAISFEKFMEDEQREMFSTDPFKQNLSRCIELADFTLTNNGTLDDFKNEVQKLYVKIKRNNLRPDWDDYFMQLTRTVAKRATCDRGRTASIVVRDKRVLTTGYVGSPPGLPHCDEVGHLYETRYDKDGKESKHCIRTTHAEQNAIAQSAKHGISLDSGTLYCKLEPCQMCAKLIISAGIKRVVCERRYHAGQLTRQMFKDAGIQLDVLYDEVQTYSNQ